MRRGFEIIRAYEKKEIILPKRKTKKSAGYDLAAAEDIFLKAHDVTLIPTGLKVFMPDDEFLGLFVRSSLAVRHKISCVNDVGVIDADYYNNESNEGHIFVAVYNHGDEDVFIKKGTRVAQGIFLKYQTIDNDDADEIRRGGFGSTGESA